VITCGGVKRESSSVTVCGSCEQRNEFPRSSKKGNEFLGCVSDW
jgi:hypothetical protein